VLVAAALACAAAGCGGGGDYANEPRPPAPIGVTAAISDQEISVSPKTFGGGPVVFTISNQTSQAQTLTLETRELGGSRPGLKQTTGPINPHGTAVLKVEMRQGSYALSVRGGGIPSVTLKVGRTRPSAQDQLLQP
jgi:hypothetical protein